MLTVLPVEKNVGKKRHPKSEVTVYVWCLLHSPVLCTETLLGLCFLQHRPVIEVSQTH